MEPPRFTDERIDAVRGGAALTSAERTWLIQDTPRFEECQQSTSELEAMSDATLMSVAMRVWADYCR